MKSRLEALAYGMLGSVAEAQDVVQEAHLRLHTLASPPESEEAFLYRVVSNLSIDRLRRAKREREAYYGPWLPEPVQEDHAHQVELAQELTMAFMHLLETLPPSERIVYVLRESFDLSFEELGNVLDISAQTARQRAHRARKRLQQQAPVTMFSETEGRALVERLVEMVGRGDVQGLVSLMSDDVIAYSDGGGVVSAAIRPVHGAERIATVLIHLAKQAPGDAPFEMRFETLNRSPALVISQAGEIHSVHFIAGRDGRIARLYTVRNPHKLAHLSL